jgi:TPR repeat protein
MVHLNVRDIILKKLLLAVAMALPPSVGFTQNFDKGLVAYDGGDFATAFKEWLPLAEQGNAKAQFRLGRMYRKGEGGTYDALDAVNWFRKAAEQGHADAHTSLGAMYYNGDGVNQDYVYALMWLNIAALQGNVDAQESRNVIAIQMPPEDISRARELARECIRNEYKDC